MATVEEPRAAEEPFIRPDGKEKVTGLGRYTADLNLTGQLHAKFRYADHPHARIKSIDVSKARALPGVLAVLTHEDVPDVKYGGMVQDRRLFAKDKVLWEGDVVAGVAATTPEIAEQAAALVEIDYEPLPAVVDYEAATTDATTLVHDDWESDKGSKSMGRDRNRIGYSTIVKGDADAAMAGADVVVKGRYVTDCSQGVPIEPRAIIAEWHGDKVTVWSSTQVPYAARGGVAHTLQIPEANVRIIVPLLGGGFGAKCNFHFEGHIAALAKAARRPVKLVFSRREEFVAVEHRREGMVIELETGARRDGTLVARRGRLVLDKGAYCGEGGFFAQMAAMHACGPYKIENVNVESSLTYSNKQPSSSIRAPTAPQVCWAVEQHMDELARALDLDPVELRRRTLIEEGAEGPTRQVFEKLGMKETLERAVELIGYGQELPEDEAIGVACGWWPCFGAASGAYVKLNGDGTGTIITGAQENGTGAVMALPVFVAQELGMKPEDFSLMYQDTDAAPWDMGSCGSQTTLNSGRAVIEAAQDLREQLLDAAAEELEADRERSRARRRRDPRQGRAGEVGFDRRPGRVRSDLPRQGLRRGAGGSAGRGGRLRGTARAGIVPRSAADHARRAREGRSRDRRHARAEGRRSARLGRDPQPDRRERPGLRRCRDGHRPGADRGHAVRRGRTGAQSPPARLQARDDRGRPGDRDRLGRDAHGERRPAREQGRRRAALRGDGGRDRERHHQGDRLVRQGAADDARTDLGGIAGR